jgi:hypothetical protein
VRPERKVCKERRAQLEPLVRRDPKAQQEHKALRARSDRPGLKGRLEAMG